MGDLAGLIARVMGKEDIRAISDSERVRPRGSEVERLVADWKLARELLGWEPRVSLEEGLGLTIEWMRQHAGGYHPDRSAV